jgi:hypothetical protein
MVPEITQRMTPAAPDTMQCYVAHVRIGVYVLRGSPAEGAGRHWWARLSPSDLKSHQLPPQAGPYHRPDGW